MFGTLLVSVAWTTGPGLLRQVGQSAELAGLPYSEKRLRVMGPFYGAVKRLDRDLPARERLAIVFADQESSYPAVVAGYYLYPRETRGYYLLSPWRNDPNRPLALALADVHDPAQIRRLDYLGIRRRLHLQTPRTAGAAPSSSTASRFAVPLAGSLDGPGEEDIYVVEAVLESSVECQVTLNLFPSGLSRTYSLTPDQPMRFADLVGEAFGRLELGWLEVTATAPVRSAFWYVDRGRRQIESLPIVEHWPALPFRLEGTPGRMFVINPTDRPIELNLNGTIHSVAPRAMPVFPALHGNRLDANGPVFAFTTHRDVHGRTYFGWPEQTPGQTQ